jgi:DNA-binding Lrp family transcriptional regulator
LKFDPKFFQGTGTSPQDRLTFHPEAERFPMMGDEAFDLLVEDIRETGLQNKIVLYDEQILDGRNRYLACLKAGIEPEFEEFTGKDPVAFVYSVNVHRRHLSFEQKLDLIDKLLAEAPERSDRAIAKLAQVHHKTVGRRRAELEERGAERHVEKRIDSKGRSYPAHNEHKAPVALVSLTEPDDGKPASWVFGCAAGLRHGDLNRNVNVLLNLLGVEKEKLATLPKPSRAALARRFNALVDIVPEDLRPVDGVPAFADGFCLGARTEAGDEQS